MTSDLAFGPFGIIVAMALATYLTRVSGFWLMSHVPMTIRVRRMIETLPGAIVIATVVPLVARAGTPGMIGIAATFAAMLLRRNEFIAVAVGLTAIGLARLYGF